MTSRSEPLQSFIDATVAAYDEFVRDLEARRSMLQVFSALDVAAAQRSTAGSRLPVCSHLEQALEVETSHPSLHRLIARFKSIEPLLEWHRRSSFDSTASANFVDGHANAMVIGPGGLEHRRDIWIGASLLAPKVRYPDHNHAPEEVYLVLSEGEFRQGDGPWFSPGIGGSLYNEPHIKHAMRSGDTPLFALWMLRPSSSE
jgi:hypothetical protein